MSPNNALAVAADYSDARILRAAAAVGVIGGAGQAAPRLLSLLSNPLVSSRDVAALVGQEPGLSVRVLRIANSAFYGQSRAISTVDAAIRLLGLEAVRGVAAAACMDRTLAGVQKGAPMDLGRLVDHSLATAIAARELARRHAPEAVGDAFIGGLLHNLGITVQLQLDPAGVGRMLAARQAGASEDILALEAGRVGVGHQHCLQVIFSSWNLPPSLVAACCHHHDPQDAPPEFARLAATVHLGAWLALACGQTYALEPAAGTPSGPALACLGMAPEALEPVREGLPEQFSALKAALHA
jgi:HD-like signal output (HDOD) protein